MPNLQQIQQAQPEMPDVFILQKMAANEITDASSRICCDGHFFPVSIAGIPASEYETDVYRLTPVESANGISSSTQIAAQA